MLDLSPEIAAAAPPNAAALIARERREIFSIHPELRAMSWMGAILISAGVAILLAKNYERIGPVLIASAVGLAAALAYGYAVWRRRTGGTSLVDEYVLLLGALLLSGDLAFIEGQFHLLDHGWPRHLLVLAVVHGLTAYYFDSRTLLSLSLTALAGWMGIEQRVSTVFDSTTETAVRALVCSLLVVMWRFGDAQWRTSRTFERVFEHFAANLALAGSLILMFDDGTRPIGTLLTLAFALLTIWHGFRVRSEAFVIYGYIYGIAAILVFVGSKFGGAIGTCGVFLIVLLCAIGGLYRLHFEFKRRAAG